MAKSRPKLDIALGQKAIERWKLRSAPFCRNPAPLDARFRTRLLPFGFVPRHAPGHVLAQSLSADCYASYGVQLSLCRISALQARSRMQHHEGMHLLIKGFSVRPALGRPYAAPHQGQTHFSLAVRALSVR